ncbi:MAG TPA: efflux transporter periplasmic adaptor subunit, partial [Pseudolabrys sp.]|nr:efflux transporter periplasmic adaptor subunit [Pseudolabrys sp.]
MKRHRLLIVLLIVLLATGAGWWTLARAPQVAAMPATRGTAVEIVYATGGVEPVRWAKVASVIHDRIVEICDCEGKSVTKGDVLARLNSSEVQAGLKELKAREDFLKREMSRVSDLIVRGSATTQAYERAAMDLQTVQGLIAVQTEKISDYTIVAPMDGIVLRRDGEIGEIAEAGQILFR